VSFKKVSSGAAGSAGHKDGVTLAEVISRLSSALIVLEKIGWFTQIDAQGRKQQPGMTLHERHEDMAPRHNACSARQRVPAATRASTAHQPEHKKHAQCGSGEQSAALLETFLRQPCLTLELYYCQSHITDSHWRFHTSKNCNIIGLDSTGRRRRHKRERA
jgi:hypothetical protein